MTLGGCALVLLGTPNWTPLSTNATCQLEKVEKNAGTGTCGWLICIERWNSPVGLENGSTAKNSQNVGDKDDCASATMLSTKRPGKFETEVVAPHPGRI